MHFDFHNISNDLVDFCTVAAGSSIITVLHPLGMADLIVEYVSNFLMWSAWLTTALVGFKTLSGKKTIGEALKYFKEGFFNIFKKK